MNMLGVCVGSSLCAYGLSKVRFKGRNLMFAIIMATVLLPGTVTSIPLYIIYTQLQWTGTLLPLWVPIWFGGGAMNIFLVRQFMKGIPNSYSEAAILDGASQLRVFFAITVPMSKPIIIYTVLTSFISPWCDFIFVNTIINDREKYTVALGLYKMINAEKSSFNENFTVFCAGACVVGSIITALFMSMQRYYVEGVTSGAVKG
jgi:ABC-type glycerol-3-phosphate transport system permease component